jgi:hypothetical protein
MTNKQKFRRWKDFTTPEKIVKASVIGYAVLAGIVFGIMAETGLQAGTFLMLLPPLFYFLVSASIIWIFWNTP